MTDPAAAATTRKPRKRKAGASSTVNVSPDTAKLIEELEAHYTGQTGFAIDRQQIVARAVVNLSNEVRMEEMERDAALMGREAGA